MKLFDPLTLRALTLPNRIVVSPMCQYSAVDGRANDWHLVHWGQLLMSGAGLYDDGCEEALDRMLHRARAQCPPIAVGMQLAHAGRKASSSVPWEGGQLIPLDRGGWRPVAPSAIPHAPGEAAPIALDHDGLTAIRDAFVESARRAHRAGIESLELHMAHGYLLHEFLSPISNARDDAYGGDFESRIRFPMEVFDAVRAAWPEERPLGVRVSSTDWVEGGWTLEETIELTRRLVAHGCDFIDASSGGVSPAQKIPLGPSYQVRFAREIRSHHGSRAGTGDHRLRRRRPHRNGPRLPMGSALGVARCRDIESARKATAAVRAQRAARSRRRVPRRDHRHALMSV